MNPKTNNMNLENKKVAIFLILIGFAYVVLVAYNIYLTF